MGLTAGYVGAGLDRAMDVVWLLLVLLWERGGLLKEFVVGYIMGGSGRTMDVFWLLVVLSLEITGL